MSRKCAAHEYVPPIFPAQFLRLAPRATRQGCTIRVVATCRSSELPARFARGRLPPSPYHGSRPRPGGRGPSTGAPGPADELPAVRRAQLAVRGGSVPAGSAGRKVGADHIEVQAMSEDGGAAEGGPVSVRDPRVSSEPTPGRVHRMGGRISRAPTEPGRIATHTGTLYQPRTGQRSARRLRGGRRYNRQATVTLAMSVTRCQRLRLIAIHRGIHRGAHLPPLHHFRVFQRNRPFKGAGGGWGESLGLRRL
jgi:hypothetical protein